MKTDAVQKVSYILSQFPETHETFIVREISEMERQGVAVEIFSLKKCRDKVIQKEAVPLMQKTHYPNKGMVFQSMGLTIFFAATHPLQMARILSGLFRDNRKKPSYLLKTLAMVPVGIWIGWKTRQAGISHLHAHWATVPTETAWVASQAWTIPYSFTAHAWDIFLHPGNLQRLIRDAARVVTCTKFNKKYLRDKFGLKFADKIDVIYHGLSISQINDHREKRNEPFVILAVGRLVEQKGFSYLIRALNLLKSHSEKATLWLIGTGPLRESLENEAEKLGVRNWIEFRDVVPQEEVFSLMRQADVFVMPSVVAQNQDRDGIPNVILEAMAHRLPVVGTSVSGLPEVVQEGVTGRLVPPESPQELAEAILFVKRNPEKAKKLAHRGRELVVENFDIRKNVFRMREKLGLVGS